MLLLLPPLLSGEGLRWWRDLSPPTSWISVATAPLLGSGSVTEWAHPPGSLVRPAQPQALWCQLTEHLRVRHREGGMGLWHRTPCHLPAMGPWARDFLPILFLMIHFRLEKKVELSI